MKRISHWNQKRKFIINNVLQKSIYKNFVNLIFSNFLESFIKLNNINSHHKVIIRGSKIRTTSLYSMFVLLELGQSTYKNI